ncbi:MAG: cellulose synthase catalytic subunit [Spirochaetes bacterium]|nr:cellulose synthase catalytic subunit [Spirochaetota bacterium]MBU1079787.1 cellulose synthase catalytic subunit [Spirochaetota bacterium]
MAISGYSSVRSSAAEARPRRGRTLLLRIAAAATLVSGCVYLGWRWTASVNADALALGILLALAESYGLVDSFLYAVTMWKPAYRSPPPPLAEATVDVFITTYNESAELVRMTAEAAMAIDWAPLAVHILDDGARDEIRELAAGLGCGYLTRSEEWKGRNRHAKAGNVNNALALTSGEFILILDADQVPDPRIVKRVIGYFSDPALAFVQTPQSFYNLPPGDPFGSDAPLFYGPIMRGKDGWGAAFFCGSNAVLRREALMQVGLISYARAAEEAFRASLSELRRDSRASFRDDGETRERKRELRRALRAAGKDMRSGRSLQSVAGSLKEAVAAFRCPPAAASCEGTERPGDRDFGIARITEAIAVEGVSTVSVTEDMATALRLHASGWKSVFHSEVLAWGLAPEDLAATLAQRLRWAQGTVQVLLRDSPLTKKGLRLGQRIMYSATIFSYFSGFSNLVFILCPIVFLLTGIAPVKAWNQTFFALFLPFFALNRWMFYIAAEGLDVKRGEQYNLALFPLWIKAVVGVISGRKIAFAVTPKVRRSGNYLGLIKVQVGVICLIAAGVAWALLGLAMGWRRDLFGVLVNAMWGCYNVWQLMAIVRAARYAPPAGWAPRPPFGTSAKGA